MSITATFKCDGCDEKAEGTTWFFRTFRSISGRSWGLGSYTYNRVQDLTPEGWIDFDPYTGCCYCPACWKGIMHEETV